jgi:hypothetical protein
VNHHPHFEGIVKDYVQLAVEGLPQMFDQNSGLFCNSFKKIDGRFVQEGRSPRYTMMTLLGLDQLERAGGQSPLPIQPVLDGLLGQLDWVDCIGDLGLLLWVCAALAAERLPEIGKRLEISTALARYEGGKTGNTMELAWFLTGLCHWGLARPEQLSGLRELASATYLKIRDNQGAQGIFAHMARTGSLRGRIRGWIGTFADQVYPIYAFAKYADAYHIEQAAQEAVACAHAICQAQGPLGQWCWHYDSTNGRLVAGYPVFSVHQHAMGPMALFALQETTGTDFGPWIYKGLEWVAANELHVDMRDSAAKLIWRCIGRPRWKRSLDTLFGRAVKPVSNGSPGQFRILHECRPYELGWLLFAFAGRTAQSLRPADESSALRDGFEPAVPLEARGAARS